VPRREEAARHRSSWKQSIIDHHLYKSTMGLGSGSKCIYKSKSLTQDQVLKILNDRRDRNAGTSNNSNTRMPEIDVDANQVAFKWIKSSISAAATLFNLCKLLSKLGANINVIVDPPTRHHTKRETTRRKGNAERARLKCIDLQAKLARAMQSEQRPSDEFIQSIDKELQKNLRQHTNKLPSNFNSSLKNLVDAHVPALTGLHGTIKFLVDDVAQADAVIAARAGRKFTDLIVSADSDYAAYLGDDCLCLKSFDMKGGSIHDIVLFAASQRETDRWLVVLDWTETATSALIEKAQFPIFEGEPNPLVRGVCAVAIGCDTWQKTGIPNCGPAKVKQYLASLGPSTSDRARCLVELLLKSHKKCQIQNPKVLLSFADSFVYEKSSLYGYIHGDEPNELDAYNKDFAGENTKIQDHARVSTCVGAVEGGSHYFMEEEGLFACSSCSMKICHFCCGSHEKPAGKDTDESTLLCFPCFRGDADEEIVEMEIMRDALEKNHVNVTATATFAEVLKLYDDRVKNRKLHLFQNSIIAVKYPIEPASVLCPSELEGFNGKLRLVKEITISELSRHMQHEDFDFEQIKQIIHILASLVAMKEDAFSDISKALAPALRAVMPDLLVKFADGARVHSGRRLCMRAARHSVDPTGPDIMNAKLKICQLRSSNEMAFVLTHEVKASMRKCIYCTKAAFTAEDFIACQCACRCGAEKDERVLCVHPLALLLDLGLLLFDWLAQHILLELRDRLQNCWPAVLDSCSGQFHEDLKILCSVAGSTSTLIGSTVVELLESFTVGTAISSGTQKRVQNF
jgi:hypothetical protein